MGSVEDWYSSYLKMIYPRTSMQDMELNSGASLTDYIDMSQSEIDHFKNKLMNMAGNFNPASKSLSSRQTFKSTLELLGHLKTALLNGKLTLDQCVKVKQISTEFEQLLKIGTVTSLIKSEISSILPDKIALWREFVSKCMSSQNPDLYWDLWWDVQAQKLIDPYNSREDYATSLKTVHDSSKFLKAWNYWDYKSPLTIRDDLSTILQLAENYYEVNEYKQELKSLDEQLKSVCTQAYRLLPKNLEKFYPKFFYWWHYGIPKEIFLYDNLYDNPLD
jgi:hypothetical protein